MNDLSLKDRAKRENSGTVTAAQAVLAGTSSKGWVARLLPFLGPAFIASVAYIDPGNYATNIQSGARFGYTLLWVVFASNIMAMVIQALSAKLGIASGLNLAEQCRAHFPRPVVIAMWVLMELVAMATDLAEFIGAAIGFNLLFGMPLFAAAIATAIATFLILGLEQFGFRPLEAVISVLVGVVASCYLIETFLEPPCLGQRIFSRRHPTIRRQRKRFTGRRHLGRYGHAPRDFSSFRAHPEPDQSQRSTPVAAPLPFGDCRRFDRNDIGRFC